MKKEIDTLFYNLSRIILIIPILIIVIFIFSKLQQTSIQSNHSTKSAAVISQAPLSISPSIAVALNLNGPDVCHYKSNDTDITVSIKNKKVYAALTEKNETSYMLLNGDCLYQWKQNIFTGTKTCGLSQTVSMIDMLSKMNLFSLNDLLGMAQKKGLAISSQKSVFNELQQSCKKENIADSIFTIPSSIFFKTDPLVSPAP